MPNRIVEEERDLLPPPSLKGNWVENDGSSTTQFIINGGFHWSFVPDLLGGLQTFGKKNPKVQLREWCFVPQWGKFQRRFDDFFFCGSATKTKKVSLFFEKEKRRLGAFSGKLKGMGEGFIFCSC